jgi:hypothetical protein
MSGARRWLAARVVWIGATISLALTGCGATTAEPSINTSTNVVAASTATRAKHFAATKVATRVSEGTSSRYFCEAPSVASVVDRLLGGPASCKQHPATGLRPYVGHGYTTEWGPQPPVPKAGITPRNASVTYERYVGDTYEKLGLTNPATYPGQHVVTAGVSCVLASESELFVCLPGGPWSISIILLTPGPGSLAEYEELARSVIARA